MAGLIGRKIGMSQVFEEDGEIKVGQISLEDGTLLQLRDTDGRPLWAGRGRGGGRQQ